MKNLLLIFVATALIFTKLTYGIHQFNSEFLKEEFWVYANNSNNTGHQIIAGNCSNPLVKDRVFYESEHKYGFPLTVRTQEVHYNGNKTIYCLKVLNEDNSNATVTVKQGGVGSKNVTVYLESTRGDGYKFTIWVYAK